MLVESRWLVYIYICFPSGYLSWQLMRTSHCRQLAFSYLYLPLPRIQVLFAAIRGVKVVRVLSAWTISCIYTFVVASSNFSASHDGSADTRAAANGPSSGFCGEDLQCCHFSLALGYLVSSVAQPSKEACYNRYDAEDDDSSNNPSREWRESAAALAWRRWCSGASCGTRSVANVAVRAT
jgi:hypothetical protein